MIALTITATLALAIAMPALACDEEYTTIASPNPVIALAPRPPQAPSPGAFAPFVTASLAADGTTNSTITIVDNDDGRHIEIRIQNDEVEAKIDGKVVPDDRIRRDDNGITILDENGEPIYMSNLRFGIADPVHGFYVQAHNWDDPLGGYHTWLLDKEVQAAELPKVMLGVQMNDTGPALEKQLRLEPGATTLLTSVYKGLPANTAGIEEYDIILAVEGSEMADPASIRALLKSREPGDVLELEVMRAGERKNVAVTLEQYDVNRMNAATRRGAPGEASMFRQPDGFGRLVMPSEPGEHGIGIVIDPNHMRLLREAPMAAAESLRRHALEHMRSLDIDEASLHEQIDALRSRLDELTEMMHKMIEEAAEAKEKALQEKPLKENET